MTHFIKACWTFAVPTFILLVAASWLFFTGQRDLASIVSNLGMIVVYIGNFIYIIGFHSRGRWPGLKWRERAAKLFTLQR